jgi:hypothetical protein
MSSPLALPVEDDPFNFAKHADPYPNYRRVRETTPVYWSQLLGGWALTRHADVKAALVDRRLSASRARDAQSAQLSEDLRRQLAPVDELLRRWALFLDNPDHRRIRQALMGAFSASLLESMRERVQRIADGPDRRGAGAWGDGPGGRLRAAAPGDGDRRYGPHFCVGGARQDGGRDRLPHPAPPPPRPPAGERHAAVAAGLRRALAGDAAGDLLRGGWIG